MKIKPIKTKSDYKSALKRIDEIILQNPKSGTELYDELDVLGTLVSAYEDVHFPIEAPDVVEAIKLLMDEKDLKGKDLIPYFGSKGLVSEFLNRKRGLSLKTIKSLHFSFGIPYEVLIKG